MSLQVAVTPPFLQLAQEPEAEKPGLRESLIGVSRSMEEVRAGIERCARFEVPVLVMGETGTGKELVARGIHALGPRAGEPFVALNCAAIAEPLLESELFGSQRGAFTGANRDRPGLFAAAGHGTLFLDEIGELSLDAQAKLLRVLEGRCYRPVGDCTEHRSEARVLAATNRDLEREVEAGRFRADLFYRLDVASIRVPALRERLVDLPPLVDHFLARCEPQFGVRAASRGAMEALALHRWPGNVRELEHAVTRTLLWNDAREIDAFDVREEKPFEVESSAPVNGSLGWARAAEASSRRRPSTSGSASGRFNDVSGRSV